MTETESMVVRVAKAIAVKETGSEINYSSFIDTARAAIEAMKTPTPTMRKAGEDAMPDGLRWSLEYGEGIDEYDPAPVWSSMIDKALEE